MQCLNDFETLLTSADVYINRINVCDDSYVQCSNFLSYLIIMCDWYVSVRSIAVEQVFSNFLVPRTLNSGERMQQLCSLYAAVDDHSKKW